MRYQMQISTWLVIFFSTTFLWARLYWPVAFLEALMTSEGGSHLKQGSRSAIFMAIIKDRVPSNARLFLVLVLFSPTTENTLSGSAFEWGNTRTSLATAASLSNSLAPVTYGKLPKNKMEKHTIFCFD